MHVNMIQMIDKSIRRVMALQTKSMCCQIIVIFFVQKYILGNPDVTHFVPIT